mgnify:CR=1 FL=1
MAHVSPDVEVDIESPEEFLVLAEIVSKEEDVPEALEYAKENIDKPVGLLELELKRQMQKGQVWYTVIPEKLKEE